MSARICRFRSQLLCDSLHSCLVRRPDTSVREILSLRALPIFGRLHTERRNDRIGGMRTSPPLEKGFHSSMLRKVDPFGTQEPLDHAQPANQTARAAAGTGITPNGGFSIYYDVHLHSSSMNPPPAPASTRRIDHWQVGRFGSQVAFWLVATGLTLYTLLFALAMAFRPELTPALSLAIGAYFTALTVGAFALLGLWKNAYGAPRPRPSTSSSSPPPAPAPAAAPEAVPASRPESAAPAGSS